MITLNVNGRSIEVDVDPQTPLLWVLRDTVGLTGTKYGCGMALCGACTVHLDGEPIRSCVTPVSAIGDQKITTIEGLSKDRSHPVQQAWMEIAKSCRLQRCSPRHRNRPTPISTRRWRATSVAAAPTSVFAPPFTAPPNSPRADRQRDAH